jgi:DNA polymerase-3 subunit gamma/tau
LSLLLRKHHRKELPGKRHYPQKPAVEEAPQEEAPREEALPPKDIEETVVEPGTPPPTKEVRKHWDEFIEYVMDRKKWMAHTLRLCSNVRVEETDLVLKFDDPSDCKMLQTKENIKFLTEFSQDFFQKEFKIVIKIRGADAGGVINEVGNGPQEERRALANDPLVQMATEVLGGRVVKIRTGPRSR